MGSDKPEVVLTRGQRRVLIRAATDLINQAATGPRRTFLTELRRSHGDCRLHGAVLVITSQRQLDEVRRVLNSPVLEECEWLERSEVE